jgi:hypothetical protein
VRLASELGIAVTCFINRNRPDLGRSPLFAPAGTEQLCIRQGACAAFLSGQPPQWPFALDFTSTQHREEGLWRLRRKRFAGLPRPAFFRSREAVTTKER